MITKHISSDNRRGGARGSRIGMYGIKMVYGRCIRGSTRKKREYRDTEKALRAFI